MPSGAVLQASLFGFAGPGEPSFDAGFTGCRRIALDEASWIDLTPGWVTGEARLFEELTRVKAWAQRSRWIYEQRLLEPRMTARWELASGEPLEPPILDHARLALSERYRVVLDSAGFNWYRDGRDSVAWHRDRIHRDVREPVVALLALGEPRKLLFRRYGGGPSRAFPIGHGDLLVTGGATQRAWEHAILKVARAGPRISVAFRHGVDPRAYDARPEQGRR